MDKSIYIRQGVCRTKKSFTAWWRTGQVFAWLLLLLFNVAVKSTVYGQCCLTNSLNISTGYDPATGGSLSGGSDPKWNIVGLSADCATRIGGWGGAYGASDLGGGDVSFFNNCCFTDFVGEVDWMTFQRCFYLCKPGNVTFDMLIYADDWADNFNVNGIALGAPSFPNPVGPGTGMGGFHIIQTVSLPAGNNCINITVHNWNYAAWQAFKLNLSGTISTPTPNIIKETPGCGPSWPWCTEPPITGPLNVCIGQCKTLSNAFSGGTWSSLNPSVATINSSTGSYCGVSVGTATIRYTDPCGRVVTQNITVDPPPTITSIGNTGPVCAGDPVNLFSSATGPGGITANLWTGPGSITCPGCASTTAVPPSPPSAVYTLKVTAGNGCTATATTTVIVNPLPAAYSVTGGGHYCAGGAGLHIGLSGSQTGVNYTLYIGSTPVAGPKPGTGSSLDFGIFTTPGTYTVKAVNASTLCTKNMNGSATITIDPLPVISGSLLICQGSSTTLSTSASGTWLSSVTSVATVPIGPSTSEAVTGVIPGTSVITNTSPAGCVSTVTVTVNPTAFVTGVTAAPSVICSGFPTTLTATYSGSIAPTFSWSPGGMTTNPATDIPSATTTYIVTTTLGTCTATGTVTVTVNPTPVITGALEFCDGSTTMLSSSVSGCTWTSSNTTVATVPSGPSASGVVTAVTPGVSTITVISPAGCVTSVTVTVDPTAFVTSVTAAPSTICAGDPTNLNVTYSGSLAPAITWTPGAMSGTPVIDFPATTTTYNVTTTLGSCTSTGSVMVSVNPTPAIIGPTNLCLNSFVILYPTIGGGTWTNMSPGLINVVSTVGDTVKVTGLIAGTGMIRYTLPTGCFAMITVTVAAITAPVVTLNTPNTDPTVSPYAYRIDAVGMCGTYSVEYMLHLNNWPACTAFPTQIMNTPFTPYSIYYDYPLNPSYPSATYNFALISTPPCPRLPWYPGGWWGIYQVDLLTVTSIPSSTSSTSCNCTWDIASTLTWKSAHADVNEEPVNANITTSLYIAPNPTAGVFSISGTVPPGIKSTEVVVEVLDAVGRVIYTDVAAINKGNISKQITLSNEVANGVYLVRIKNAEIIKVVTFSLER